VNKFLKSNFVRVGSNSGIVSTKKAQGGEAGFSSLPCFKESIFGQHTMGKISSCRSRVLVKKHNFLKEIFYGY
jgi:hypothetical protein